MLGNAIADIAGATACRIADGIVGLCDCPPAPFIEGGRRMGTRAPTAGGGPHHSPTRDCHHDQVELTSKVAPSPISGRL